MIGKGTVEIARKIRELSIDIVYNAKASHIGGALSMADILAVLYFQILKIDPLNPKDPNRDRFLLSKGHSCASLYVSLALKGFFSLDDLKLYGCDGSLLLCHTSHNVPGVELSTGSLGHALGVGCGLALAAKRKQNEFRTFVLLSDGELNEGSNWEAILFSPQHNLDNLILIIDFNKIQSLGRVDEVINLHPLKEKFESFNWECFEIDGHNHDEIYNTLSTLNKNNKPKVVISNTVKGKGVDFMENKLLWHYKSPSLEEYIEAKRQINL